MQVSLFIEFGNGRFRILGSVVFFLDDPVFFWDVVPSTNRRSYRVDPDDPRSRLGVRRGRERRARTNCGCTYILGVTEDFIFPKFLARTRVRVDGLVIFSRIRIRFVCHYN